MFTRHEMLELVVVEGRARGIVVRDMVTGAVETHLADAVCLATGGYGNVYFLSTYAQGLQRHRHLARLQEGRRLRQPVLHADPPHLHPGHRRAPVEAHADERVARATTGGSGCRKKQGDTRAPGDIPEDERD